LKFLAKNVQSILSDGRELELLETIDDIQWDIFFISETWRKSKEEIWKSSKGHLFLGSGWAEGHRGVAIMIHRRHVRGFKGFHAVSERACAADVYIHGTRLRFISAYMPDSSYDLAEVEATYNQLDMLCNRAKQIHRRIVLGGDMNAVVGRSRPGEEPIVGPHGFGSRNARGEWLTNWAGLQDLAFTNSFFSTPDGERWSYSSGGVQRLIDCILVDQKARDQITEANIEDTIGIGADHRTATASLILDDLTTNQPKNKKIQKGRPGLETQKRRGI
jgi:exonuclease III